MMKPAKIALITSQESIAETITITLKDLYGVDVFKNGLTLNHALQKGAIYGAIISDDELLGANGIILLKDLQSSGYGHIPFISLLNHLNDEQRKLAMKGNIAELISKPIDRDLLKRRLPYLIDNYANSKSSAEFKIKVFKIPIIKRAFDITFSALALLLLSPLFLIIALLIKLESKGPVFYYSFRVGSGYKVFRFFKFRSMFTGADAKLKDLSHLNQYNNSKVATAFSDTGVQDLCELCEQAGSSCIHPLYSDNKVVCEVLFNSRKQGNMDAAFVKIQNDPRITRVGNFIRNTSIDELPQLWNVFIGDMSIVGNRPLPLYEAEKITTDEYSLRFIAPAGITGLWQVEKRGRGEMSESERLNLDNNYAKTHSFVNDIRLILKTIPALFQSENV
jgi:lipopolysaccharide/colanic/teichoic acid biosynthesis glycosyltransferase